MKEEDDKYNLREILITHGGFTPSLKEALEHQVDLILKVEYMKQCHLSE